MLLCDLCDSPSHTCCVGLAHEVPEGNWYCNGCKPGTLGSSNSQTQSLNLDQRTNPGMSNRTSIYENMSEIDLNVTIPEMLTSQGNGFYQFSSGSIRATSPPVMGVATVSGRRLIHEQIRRHILSNRLSQTSSNVVGSSHLTHYVERLQENPSQSVQIRNSFPRLVHMMGGGVGQPSSSLNGFTNTQGEWSELDRLNLGVGRSPIMVSAQLQPCTNRSSVGPGIGASFFDPRYYEEQASTFKQVQTMVRNQVKSLSLNMNLSKLKSFF